MFDIYQRNVKKEKDIKMNDIFDDKPPVPTMPETDGKAALLAQITTAAQYYDINQIKLEFDLSDEEIEDKEIQAAIQKGELLAVKTAGEALIAKAKEGNLSAIKMLFEINKGKQAQRNYKFDYTSKDEAMLQHAEEIAKNSTIAQLAE